jgi:SAM-dependent methyltransferase
MTTANELPGGKAAAMRAQYGAWPYPKVPLLAALPSTHPYELHVDWLWDRAGRGPGPTRPRIWIAGCGTFQPYAFGVANPHADIVATDLSEPSLAVAQRRCRLHRQRHVQFAPVDLDEPSSWPAGEFDLIECYGVLMNVADPLATLRGLACKLTPNGVLRLMVYPHWSRQRVFQLQRLARLLGFHADDRAHPSAFRRFVRRLPQAHPLRYAFTTYADSKNDAGVVDAFLHAGDRGFTGHQLGALLAGAGLEPAHWFHRPWGQPDRMAERCSSTGARRASCSATSTCGRSCARTSWSARRAPTRVPRTIGEPRVHPRFTGDQHSLRHRLRLLRLRWLGGKLPSRTGEDSLRCRLRQRARWAAANQRRRTASTASCSVARTTARSCPPTKSSPPKPRSCSTAHALRVGRLAPNPLYAHLFAAYELAQRHPELELPDLELQLGRWTPWADPLEERPVTFGLTPYGTHQRFRVNLAGASRPRPAADRCGLRGDPPAPRRPVAAVPLRARRRPPRCRPQAEDPRPPRRRPPRASPAREALPGARDPQAAQRPAPPAQQAASTPHCVRRSRPAAPATSPAPSASATTPS